MKRTRWVGLMGCLTALGCLVPAIAPAAAGPVAAGATKTAHVTYLTGSSAYVDAGRDDGLREEDVLEVVRGDQVIATIKITYLSAHRASGSILGASVPLAVGDLVRFSPAPAEPPPPAPGAPSGPPPSSGSGLRGGAVHGRVGLRYLVVRDRSVSDNGFSQPAIDFRLDGASLGGSPIDLSVDVRARRTYRSADAAGAQDENLTRLYRLAVSYQEPGSRQRVTVGRQFAPALAALSIFDGVLYDINGDRFGGGVSAGVQPDDIDFGYSSRIQEYGAYVRFHNAPQAARRWGITTGAIGSYEEGSVNREFVYLQGQYYGQRLTAYVAQEVDYNRDWKVSEAQESTLAPTSTFANLRFRAGDRVTFFAGYDNRRNVRLFRDRITPVTEFDDSMRQGEWGGASFRIGEHFQTSAEARHSGGGTAGSANSYSLNLGVDRLTRANLSLRTRSTRYVNDRSEGWLHSLSTGGDLGSRCHLEISAGRLDEVNPADPALDRTTDWVGVDLDVTLGRRWYLLLSGERNSGTFESNDQGYFSVAWRF